MSNFRIRTPHAAVKIWNYVDRIPAEGVTRTEINTVKEEIISTISCSLIQTVKTKSSPVGSFSFVLAPTRNWTAVITPGSWCAIMMSNEPITQEDFKRANPKLVKMVGRIESVRTSVATNPDGSRTTQYLVSGQDWGHIFNNILYVDPLIADGSEAADQTNTLFIELINIMQKAGTPEVRRIRDNLQSLLSVMGKSIPAEGQTERVGKNTHDLMMPNEMKTFFGFDTPKVMENIRLVTGALIGRGVYNENVNDGLGWINPFSLVGTHTLWQVLQDNSNYALNEMFTDIYWEDGKANFSLVNRIKPFAFRNSPLNDITADLRSHFKHVIEHRLDNVSIIAVNAGTNWRDKYNFLEVKPDISDFQIFENWIKQKVQAWDKEGPEVFDREGFRPLIFSVKQIPFLDSNATPTAPGVLGTSVPSGTRRTVEGYYQGQRFDLTICAIQGVIEGECWVAEAAAADTQAWFNAAAMEGLIWKVNTSFRTMDEQVRLQSTGKAAPPGKSLHQSGCALDIQPQWEDSDLHSSSERGEAILSRLETLGRKYGWVRNVPNEPWHFTYTRWTPTANSTPSNADINMQPVLPPGTTFRPDPEGLVKWTALLQEWYFDTHRLLNGELTMTGSTEYICVGNNIMFDAGLLGVKANFNKGHAEADPSKQYYVLAHVESVSHLFQVEDNGARSFQTRVEFVRGIIVDGNKNLIGEGVLDTLSTALTKEASINDTSVVATGMSDDPGVKE